MYNLKLYHMYKAVLQTENVCREVCTHLIDKIIIADNK
jgi:hypothetical protein